jgi:hypothetical protein
VTKHLVPVPSALQDLTEAEVSTRELTMLLAVSSPSFLLSLRLEMSSTSYAWHGSALWLGTTTWSE